MFNAKKDPIFCKKLAELAIYEGNALQFKGKTFIFPISYNQRFDAESMENNQALVNALNNYEGEIERIICIPTFSLQAINEQINELSKPEQDRNSLEQLRKNKEEETERFMEKLEKKAFKHLRIPHYFRSWNYYINIDHSKPYEGICKNYESKSTKKIIEDPEKLLINDKKLNFSINKNKLLDYYKSDDSFEKAVNVTVGKRYNQIIQQNADKKNKSIKNEAYGKIQQDIFAILVDYVIEETAAYYLWRDLYPGAVMFYRTSLNEPIYWVQSNKRGLQTGFITYTEKKLMPLKPSGIPEILLPIDEHIYRTRSFSGSSSDTCSSSPGKSPRDIEMASCSSGELIPRISKDSIAYTQNSPNFFVTTKRSDSEIEDLKLELLKKEFETQQLKLKITELKLKVKLDPKLTWQTKDEYSLWIDSSFSPQGSPKHTGILEPKF